MSMRSTSVMPPSVSDSLSMNKSFAAKVDHFQKRAIDESAAKLEWKDLSETEQRAASLGVSPDAWKPISFMNQAHYDTLLKQNAIDGDLAKKLESYKYVASGGL